ncbi:hypothetical protein [Asanoa iriomotensis]|uniref:Membrane protein (TIGR02234 family) n=1 Tax=Asanoa iriomotensis TaxID=234613 RepID=A0ABQ4C465_9ACTN|nr:hypothetical protein [Asanoa iriomotensis]GIF57578.1 hypothetical protein Air01nite_36730 [Asanoa iriomotensis]
MRHLATFVAAVVLGPATWVLVALGQGRSLTVFDTAPNADLPSAGDPLAAFVFIAVAGMLLGVVGTLRLSPLGATLIGLGYLGSAVAAVFAPGRVINLLDHTLRIGGYDANLATPVRTGSAALLGSLLVVAVVSAKRWRQWPEAPADETPKPEDTPIPLGDLQRDTELVGAAGLTAQDRPQWETSWQSRR